MLEGLAPAEPDAIIALMQAFRDDPRAEKVDLGVGVYKDAAGRTPIFRAVKAAEAAHLGALDTKVYTSMRGHAGFLDALGALALGDAVEGARIGAAQTVGGTGAVRALFEIARRARPGLTVWLSDPTWPNHPSILDAMGVTRRPYRYFDGATREVDVEGMLADLKGAGPGDLILLHGCCHNPTGANLTEADWAAVTDVLLATGATPMVDLAYQGFGAGLEADVAGLRAMAARVPEMLLSISCSKNFGLYRDRVGAAFVIAETAELAARAESALTGFNRASYSFAPDTGAAVVARVLGDPALRADWAAELTAMRERMNRLREGLAEALRRETNSDRFDYLARHRGMFSLLGAGDAQVAAIREDAAIYLVAGGRMNVAGLPEDGLDSVARALAAAGL
ncbi:MAG: amino acid aminotransferase [Pseudomonadota bacterium]